MKDKARFYDIEGQRLPSVTTILDVLNKPALPFWYAQQERKRLKAGVMEFLTKPWPNALLDPDQIWAAIEEATKGITAGERAADEAAAIGTAAHAWIEWKIKGELGLDAGREPNIPDAAWVATMAYSDWAKQVHFKPLRSECVVWSTALGYAGTADWIGYVNGDLTLGDFKTGKAVYPEAYLQNVAYRRAAYECLDLHIPHGLILRLPKLLSDPSFEAVWVPETTTAVDFVAVARAWRWKRRAEGLTTGTWQEPPAWA